MELQACDVHKIYDFHDPVFVGDADRPSTWNNPHKILMRDLEAPLI
jgi:hypothetical protein